MNAVYVELWRGSWSPSSSSSSSSSHWIGSKADPKLEPTDQRMPPVQNQNSEKPIFIISLAKAFLLHNIATYSNLRPPCPQLYCPHHPAGLQMFRLNSRPLDNLTWKYFHSLCTYVIANKNQDGEKRKTKYEDEWCRKSIFNLIFSHSFYIFWINGIGLFKKQTLYGHPVHYWQYIING